MNKGSFVVRCLHILVVVGLAASPAFAANEESAPNFREVLDLIRTNAAGLSEEALNRAALKGLLSELNRHAWIEGDAPSEARTNSTPAASSAVLDDHYAYVRVTRVSKDLAAEFGRALENAASTNKINGAVIDLRFAGGLDYAAAGAVADNFISTEDKLLNWVGGSASSVAKTNAFRWPAAVLVNGATSGAAEALAAVLRHTDVALLIGTNTAGQASTTKDFPLSNGQTLRVATSPVKLGNGEPIGSLKPDIVIEVSPQDERAYFVDAYKAMPRAGVELSGTNVASLSVTNRGPRRRINEAELVRMLRDGEDPEAEVAQPSRPLLPGKPVISDPALARAVDLLKALAVVRHTRF